MQQPLIFRLGETVRVPCQMQQSVPLTHDDPTTNRLDRLSFLELVKRFCDAATSDTEHQPELIVRHADIILADTIMI